MNEVVSLEDEGRIALYRSEGSPPGLCEARLVAVSGSADANRKVVDVDTELCSESVFETCREPRSLALRGGLRSAAGHPSSNRGVSDSLVMGGSVGEEQWPVSRMGSVMSLIKGFAPEVEGRGAIPKTGCAVTPSNSVCGPFVDSNLHRRNSENGECL